MCEVWATSKSMVSGLKSALRAMAASMISPQHKRTKPITARSTISNVRIALPQDWINVRVGHHLIGDGRLYHILVQLAAVLRQAIVAPAWHRCVIRRVYHLVLRALARPRAR